MEIRTISQTMSAIPELHGRRNALRGHLVPGPEPSDIAPVATVGAASLSGPSEVRRLLRPQADTGGRSPYHLH
jgi:hypothetical protein